MTEINKTMKSPSVPAFVDPMDLNEGIFDNLQ